MMAPWRPLALAAALSTLVAARTATAQTVIVTKAPPRASLELALNASTVGKGTADETGVGRFTLDPSWYGNKSEIAVRVLVDTCQAARRVTLLETAQTPASPASGCSRTELFGTFAVRRMSTLVVSTDTQSPAVWIRQGAAPESWYNPTATAEDAIGGPVFPLPTRLVLFAGGGLTRYSDAAATACGTGTTTCSAPDSRAGLRAGIDYWFTPYLAVSASYLRPLAMEATGSGTNYDFTSALSVNIGTFTVKAALPLGRARLFVEAGADYQRSTWTTEQTVPAQTIALGETSITFPGGTQTLVLQTGGWGWTAGGGVEVWLTRIIGLYGEAGRAKLRGRPLGAGEGSLDDSVVYAMGGIRVRVARR